jgi:hypothetical protein
LVELKRLMEEKKRKEAEERGEDPDAAANGVNDPEEAAGDGEAGPGADDESDGKEQ